MKKSNISIIIRVRNEEKYIGFCIQSILDFFLNPEIIIIDNKSNDSSIEIINHFAKDKSLNSVDPRYTDIKIFNIDDYKPGKALNLGVSKATKDYILIISAHCKIISFDFNLSINKLDSFSALFFNQLPIWHGKRIKKRYVWSNFSENEEKNIFSKNEDRYFFHNAFSMFKKNTLLKNHFNEKLISKEDRYWANDMINKNSNILYMPQNCIEHYYTNNGATWQNL